MYTYEQKMKAIELYVKYDHRATAVSRELGYPHPNIIGRWYKEYLKRGDLKRSYQRRPKYSEEQKSHALQYYEEHGCCAAKTVRDLGYPSPCIFLKWLDEAYPNRNRGCALGGAMIEYSQEEKEQAVIDLCARNGSAKEVADMHGVSRVTLYEWKKQLLVTGGSTTM